MGLYDIVMGDGQQGARGQLLLSLLGNPPVARYRDAWAEKGDDGEPVIAIYTRQGRLSGSAIQVLSSVRNRVT